MSLKSYGITLLILVVYLTCVWCEETEVSTENGDTKLVETGRRRHGIHRWWGIYGIHALAAFYMLKIKAAIAAFLIGSAIVFGFRYYKNHGCSGIIHESPVITYDHGPAWDSGPHDHIPYSLDHNPYEHDHDHHFGGSDIVSDSYPGSFSGGYSDTAPTAPSAVDEHQHGRQLESEEQVSEIMFAFLGIKNVACRRRFICEMEYRSKENPFTRMAFGIVGRGLFSKYVNNKNANGRAHSFAECASVNPECELVGENFENNETSETNETNETDVPNDSENEARSLSDEPRDLEQENEANLKAELKSATPLQKDPIAQAIFSRSQTAN